MNDRDGKEQSWLIMIKWLDEWRPLVNEILICETGVFGYIKISWNKVLKTIIVGGHQSSGTPFHCRQSMQHTEREETRLLNVEVFMQQQSWTIPKPKQIDKSLSIISYIESICCLWTHPHEHYLNWCNFFPTGFFGKHSASVLPSSQRPFILAFVFKVANVFDVQIQ